MSKMPNGGGADIETDGAANNYPDGGATMVLMGDSTDPAKVQFLNGSKEEKESSKSADSGDFVGLRKEELAKYATDPYWVRLRIILLVVFAALWIAMLIAAIIIIVLAPRCPPRPEQEWYEKSVIYHIHPLSFQDSDRDSFGDIKGIHNRLDYLYKELKVDVVSLGPIYPSGFLDDGYDVKNHIKPCPGHYGTEEDFNSLRAALHKYGMKLILDFIPNHTSKSHSWFTSSINDTADPKFKDFYIWAGDNQEAPPNLLKNVYGEPAWTWREEVKQWYYHTFSADEPDLNLRNPEVKAQLASALKVWLDLKVDGFTIRDAEYLVEPLDIGSSAPGTNVTFQQESYALVAEWRKLLDDYTEQESKSRSRKTTRVLIADVNGTPEQTVKFSKYIDNNGTEIIGANLATNKVLTHLKDSCDSQCVLELIKSWTSVATGVTSNWQVGGVNVSRVATRYQSKQQFVNAVNLLVMTLGGSATTLYGEELGMVDGLFSKVQSLDFKIPTVRGQLNPMEWNNSIGAGFTDPSVVPWRPIAANHELRSLQTQNAHGSDVNHVEVYQRLVELRSGSESLKWGALKGVTVQSGVLMYMREAEGFNRLLVAINFNSMASTVDFNHYARSQFHEGRRLPEEMTIVSSTFNFKGAERVHAYNNGVKILPDRMIYLEPSEGVVLSWPPSADHKY